MPKITLLKDEYHSTDPWNGDKPINLSEGQSVEVSDQKAGQVQRDFSDRFKVETARKPAKGKSKGT